MPDLTDKTKTMHETVAEIAAREIGDKPVSKEEFDKFLEDGVIDTDCPDAILNWVNDKITADRQQLREKVSGLFDCIGPTDEPHRCSYGHCKNCGRCDVLSDVLAIIDQENEP